MGKRRFNEKGRQKVETIIDDSETKKIKLDFAPGDEYGGQDNSNVLVLPSKKRETKIKKDRTVVTKILSKKQRKRLEKIVDQKKKKENRSSLIASLVAVQASKDDLSGFRKLSEVQTKGLKQHFKEQKYGVTYVEKPFNNAKEAGVAKIKSLVGSRRKRLALLRQADPASLEEVKGEYDPNVVGLNDESSDDESEEEGEEEGEEGSEQEEEENEQESAQEDENDEVDKNQPEQESITEEGSKKVENAPPEDVKQPNGEKEKPIVVDRKPATYIHVERDPAIQAARLKLPILGEEQIIMETISENKITILAGETGSGKTTQIPQFLYEAGYGERGLIGVTEPRRVAAVSMSKRVAHEMNLSTDVVSYLIRYEGNVTDRTKIKFMTDGVLLKEIEVDFLLNKYSCIILDEAHERSVYTDILMGLLSRIVRLREKRGNNPLRVIIMSATLRVQDFTENKKLFLDTPPVINIDSRQFPVTVHFNKTTPDDYLREAFLKTVKIHTKLPDGGILVFLTGQKEVNTMVRKLRKMFPLRGDKEGVRTDKKVDEKKEEVVKDEEDEFDNVYRGKPAHKPPKAKSSRRQKRDQLPVLPQINLDAYDLPHVDDTEGDRAEENDTASELDSDDDDDELNAANLSASVSELRKSQPLWVLPLYSMLSPDKQQLIFQPPPEGARLCVVATNVAETSLTIPDIKYVVDTGRQKTKLYDKTTGVTAFVVTYTSKASANQRAGRAGRVAPGHCYRLYSSAVFNDEFVEFAPPEVQQKPVDGLMLQMKCMGIDKVLNFPFPSPPDPVQLMSAEQRLLQLGALEQMIVRDGGQKVQKNQTLTRVTELGRTMAAFPVAPRFGKMLALSHQHALLPYVICLVAALSVQEVLEEVSLSEESNNTESGKRWRQKRKIWAGTGESLLLGDPMILLKAVGAAEHAHSKGVLEEFCTENGIRLKAIREIRKLRIQLTNEVNANLLGMNLAVDPDMAPPTATQIRLLRQLLLIGNADQIARKLPESDIKLKTDARKLKHAYNLPMIDEPVFLHASSVLRREQPEWVCYQEAYEAIVPGVVGEEGSDKTKMFVRGITAIEPDWLPKFVPNVCNAIDVLEEPIPPAYNAATDTIECHVRATFGKTSWELPASVVEMPKNMLRCKYLLKFILQGIVFKQLKPFRKSLLSSPDSVLKLYSTAVPRIDAALKVMLANELFNAQRFHELWQADPKFFCREYADFLPVSCHEDVAKLWPPVE
uniref:RNA helicase n=1 Tax=Anopheles quadriannulatus TaxID=34691 RepID=A0A1Y9J143_ANOQN